MGKLHERTIATLFHGVSRQPDTVRLDGQIQDGDDILPSIVSGGFDKRPGSEHVAELAGLPTAEDLAVHFYDRDASERYVVVIKNGGLFVYDAFTGSAKTINVSDDTRKLITAFTSVGTGVVSTHHIAYLPSETQIDLVSTSFAGGLQVQVHTSPTGLFAGEETLRATISTNTTTAVTIDAYVRFTKSVAGTGTFSITGTFRDMTYLLAATPSEDFSFVTIADHTLILNKNVTTALKAATTGTLTGTVQAFSNLPGSPTLNDIYKITGKDTDSFTPYYVKFNGSTWEESVNPNGQNDIEPQTMPYLLRRETNGSFTFLPATWNSRAVGDSTLVPAPDFIGRALRDIAFFRDRLFFLADETANSSQSGDYFNFWPDKAIDVLDSDPFSRSAGLSSINLLNFAVSFRRAMFATSDKWQFELTSEGILTERTASFNPTTNFKVNPTCRPLAIGETLYFVADNAQSSVVFEYEFSEDSFTNSAIDVSKHVETYLPAPFVRIEGDSASGTLACLSSSQRHRLYLYRFFFNDKEKVQSAWFRWNLGADASAAYILGHTFMGNYLYVVVRRGSKTFLERFLASNEFGDETSDYLITNVVDDETIRWPVRLDRRVLVTGSYNSGTNLTTWTSPYPHGNALVGVLTDEFDAPGKRLTFAFPTSTTVTAVGDYSADPIILGQSYTKSVTLSGQFVRDNTNKAITSGRLQLLTFQFDFQNTGYFTVEVTPSARPTKTWRFTGRVLGAAENLIGQVPIAPEGSFRVPVNANARKVRIVIKNDSHVPSTITSARWVGFFNELSRQG